MFWVGKGDSLFSGMGGRLSGGKGGPRCSRQGEGGSQRLWGGQRGAMAPGGARGSRGEGVRYCSPGGGRGFPLSWVGNGAALFCGRGGWTAGRGGQGGSCPSRGPSSPWGDGTLAAPGEGGSSSLLSGTGGAQKRFLYCSLRTRGGGVPAGLRGRGGGVPAACREAMGGPGCPPRGGPRPPPRQAKRSPEVRPAVPPPRPGPLRIPGPGGDATHGEERDSPGGLRIPAPVGGTGHAERSGGTPGGSACRGRGRTGEPRGAPRSARVASTGPPPAPRPPCGSRPVLPVLTGERVGAGQARAEQQQQQREHREQRRRRHGRLRCPSVPEAAERTGTSGEVPSKSEQPPVTKAPTAALAPPRDRPRGGRKPPAPPPPPSHSGTGPGTDPGIGPGTGPRPVPAAAAGCWTPPALSGAGVPLPPTPPVGE